MSGYGAALKAGFIALFIMGLIVGIGAWELLCWLFRHLSFTWS